MMKNCLGIINLDENKNKMNELVRNRTLASVPLASRYRVIDFVLSNMANAGIEDIGIFTENKSRSLVEHLTNGRPWDLNRKKDGLRVFNFGDNHPHFDDVLSERRRVVNEMVESGALVGCYINSNLIRSKEDLSIIAEDKLAEYNAFKSQTIDKTLRLIKSQTSSTGGKSSK